MNLNNQVQKMDAMVAQGAIVDAVKAFFADNATTSDYGNVITTGKNQMVEKMEGFAGSIAKVNGIQHHYTIIGEGVTASEFTFDFDMKDGSKIYWHEIIRRVWNEEGLVINEEYFDAKN
jgi:hypothetical protein